MNLRTFQRHAAALREYGIDINEKRNIACMPLKYKNINAEVAPVPHWYSFEASPLHLVAA
jgi:hypothetical protein